MSIATARLELADAYTAAGVGVVVWPAAPRTITPPAVAIVPGSPYFDPDAIGASFAGTVRLDVVALVPPTDAETELAALEDLVTACMQATPEGWTVAELQRPELVALDLEGDRQVLATRFTVSTRIDGP